LGANLFANSEEEMAETGAIRPTDGGQIVRDFEATGQRFIERGGEVLRVAGKVGETVLTVEGGFAAAAIAVGSYPGVPVSREEAERIGAQERATAARGIAAGIAPSLATPFSNPAYVARMPTAEMIRDGMTALAPAAAIDATTAPNPRAGNVPTMHAPGLTPPHAGGEAADLGLEAYKYVPTAGLAAGVTALAAVNQCVPNAEAFRSFGALRNAMSSTTPQGWEVHHIVEQNQTLQFGSEVIQNRANAIALPEDVHKEVGAIYSRKPREFSAGAGFSHERDYIRTLPFEEQREIGIQHIRDAMNNLKTPRQTRDIIEKELTKLDVPVICGPPKAPKIDPNDLQNVIQNAVDAHNQTSGRPLPDARSVSEWNGSTRSGTFLDLGNGQVAQHQGQGAYAVADVQQQLGSVQPPIGQYATLQQGGQIQASQQTQSLGMQLG